ncbi:MAG: SGNH/GDSL hydrolase family protein [Anaerolineaceae bacterium]|nr:SGNH/GDSL hydrolase family protein [Anaerolineaceae bacterium]
MKNKSLLVLAPILLVFAGLAACSPAPSAATTLPSSSTPASAVMATPLAPSSAIPSPSSAPSAEVVASATAPSSPSASPQPTLAPTLVGTATPDTRPDPKYWSSWPVIPTISAAAQAIYQHGIALGNNPHVFSAIGDCQSAPNVFMGSFETEQSVLGPNDVALKQTVLYFAGSFSRKSLAVHDGLSPASALSPLWADRTACGSDESPVACELRVRKPSIMFINLGTNWKAGASAAPYEAYLRQIVDLLIAHGTLPVLSTKADNVEGDRSLDLATAKVAHDYDIPLWNFWLASNGLPNHGLDASRDNVYLAPLAWGPRNYTALQVLDKIWRTVNPNAAATAEAQSATAAVTGVTATAISPRSTSEITTSTVSTTAP